MAAAAPRPPEREVLVREVRVLICRPRLWVRVISLLLICGRIDLMHRAADTELLTIVRDDRVKGFLLGRCSLRTTYHVAVDVSNDNHVCDGDITIKLLF